MNKKNTIKKIVITAVIVLTVMACCACGHKYTCSWCGRETSTVYHTQVRPSEYFCESCAKQYFGPNLYTSFRVK